MRCFAFVVVQAETMARGNAGVNAGALCSTGAASSALTCPLGIGSRFCRRAVGRVVVQALMRARVMLGGTE